MENLKHTPGEWVARIDEVGIDIIQSNTGFGITHLGNYYKLKEADYDIETAKANAKLIAAAPQLLEACEWALQQFKLLADKGVYPEHMLVENGGSGLAVLTKAIKKAKGE